jgi:hypothetical protein
MAETENAFKKLIWKSCGKRPLTRLGSGWEDDIETDLRKIGCEHVKWTPSENGPVAAASVIRVTNLWVFWRISLRVEQISAAKGVASFYSC